MNEQKIVESIAGIMKRHGAKLAYKAAVVMLREVYLEDHVEDPEEQKELYHTTMDILFRAIGHVFKDKEHCGELVEVKAFERFEEESTGVQVRCKKCNDYWYAVKLGKGPQDALGSPEDLSADAQLFTLRELREIRDVSAESVAKALGFSLNTLNRYEQDPGKLPLVTAIKFARYYNLRIDDIDFSSTLH